VDVHPGSPKLKCLLSALYCNTAGVLSLLKKYRDRDMDLADACIVPMTELMRDGRVVTLDRADFAVYRRNGRELIPVIVPPVKQWPATLLTRRRDRTQFAKTGSSTDGVPPPPLSRFFPFGFNAVDSNPVDLFPALGQSAVGFSDPCGHGCPRSSGAKLPGRAAFKPPQCSRGVASDHQPTVRSLAFQTPNTKL
jgi:hypothetical protein